MVRNYKELVESGESKAFLSQQQAVRLLDYGRIEREVNTAHYYYGIAAYQTDDGFPSTGSKHTEETIKQKAAEVVYDVTKLLTKQPRQNLDEILLTEDPKHNTKDFFPDQAADRLLKMLEKGSGEAARTYQEFTADLRKPGKPSKQQPQAQCFETTVYYALKQILIDVQTEFQRNERRRLTKSWMSQQVEESVFETGKRALEEQMVAAGFEQYGPTYRALENAVIPHMNDLIGISGANTKAGQQKSAAREDSFARMEHKIADLSSRTGDSRIKENAGKIVKAATAALNEAIESARQEALQDRTGNTRF